MTDIPLGRLFPAGGPADPDMMIGRANDLGDVVYLLNQGVHVLLSGERRSGKTTVCKATCARLQSDEGFKILHAEVPERSNSIDLCQLILDRSSALGVVEKSKRFLRAAEPLIEKLLSEKGLPFDLAELGRDPTEATRRKVLELPLDLAKHARVVFFLDELQRVADYDDGEELIRDLTDLYAGQDQAVVLTDGSNQRTFEQLLGDSDGLGKLVTRRELAATIPREQWADALPRRFEQAGHPIEADALEALLDFGQEAPYRTMTAARGAAVTADRLGGATDSFCVEDGIRSAEKRLADDGY